MCDNDELYFLRFEHRPLTPDQWQRLERYALWRAQVERGKTLRRAFAGIAAAGRAVGRAARRLVGGSLSAYVNWRVRRAAVSEISGLDDRVLKDIGVHRSEIESLVYDRDARPAADERIATPLLPTPSIRPLARPAPRPAQQIERDAA